MFFYYLLRFLSKYFKLNILKILLNEKNKFHFKKLMILNNNKITILVIYKRITNYIFKTSNYNFNLISKSIK